MHSSLVSLFELSTMICISKQTRRFKLKSFREVEDKNIRQNPTKCFSASTLLTCLKPRVQKKFGTREQETLGIQPLLYKLYGCRVAIPMIAFANDCPILWLSCSANPILTRSLDSVSLPWNPILISIQHITMNLFFLLFFQITVQKKRSTSTHFTELEGFVDVVPRLLFLI